MKARWERAKTVAEVLKVHERSVRRWASSGWVESRREGPRVLYIRVHAEGELEGRPIGLADEEKPT